VCICHLHFPCLPFQPTVSFRALPLPADGCSPPPHAQAAESFALTLAAWGWVRPASLPRRLDVLMFALASGFILHCYSDHGGQRRSVFRSSYLNVFDVRPAWLMPCA
jgi:hypothetical protein